MINFATVENEQISLKCAISYTDLEGARRNFLSECANSDFDTMKHEADISWEKAFECIDVEGGNEVDKTIFTLVYIIHYLIHALLWMLTGDSRMQMVL